MLSRLYSVAVFVALLVLTYSFPVRRSLSSSDAQLAFSALQQWYNETNGLWIPSTGWWNSANCLTTIANLALLDGSINDAASYIFTTTYANAQLYNQQLLKVVGSSNEPWLPQSYYGPEFPPNEPIPPFNVISGFLDGYYDDEGWWALAWIAAYDVTNNLDYLSQAESIFSDMYQSFGNTPCSENSGGTGGIWWDKSHTYVNAIANELFLSVAAHLANRALENAAHYLSVAMQQWTWFQGSGMINAVNTINDGLTKACQNNGGTVWSYNQGVVLGGLSELSRATNDPSYIQVAQGIADAAIAKLSVNGTLHDVCEPNCGPDGSQFKGVFMRNLQLLQTASPQSRYASFLQDNANSIWGADRNDQNQLSLIWSGPFVTPPNASTQSSALDALVAALAVNLDEAADIIPEYRLAPTASTFDDETS